MTPRTLRRALLGALFFAGCGGAGNPPPAPAEDTGETAGDAEEAREPLLHGSYRIVALGGEPIVETLVRDPSCYAGRALFTFGDESTLSFSLETACAGHDRYETVCTAELTTDIEWERDAFHVPSGARARGMVSQLWQPDEDDEDATSRPSYDDSCHVGIQPMRWRVRQSEGEDGALELENEHGDVMTLVREIEPEVDWRAVTREGRARRTGPPETEPEPELGEGG